MNILTLNAGSSSLKAALYTRRNELLSKIGEASLSGVGSAHLALNIDGKAVEITDLDKTDPASIHAAVVDRLFEQFNLVENELIVSHRVVHGGGLFSAPALVDDVLMAQLTSFNSLAPLHQPFNLRLIEQVRAAHPGSTNVVAFDTMFHAHQPELETCYALPKSIRDMGIRRYGFHGLSYAYIADSQQLCENPEERTVVLHLGAGSSACGMLGGVSRASSMGFSAVDGLPMGSRTGNLDPGVMIHLMREGMSADQLEMMLYKQSGWLGLSGLCSDMRTLIESTKQEAKFTVDYYCYHITQEIGRLAAILGGLDRVIFTAGVGEHAPLIREKVCSQLAWLGLEIDNKLNQSNQIEIATESSKVRVQVVPTDEEWMLAKYATQLV
ncbi:Acetate kinase [Marinobacterium sp. xm-d-579]|uniref:acetate/propionate family kinase n=1 Tax=Marinobacterium sp. xm-d-579 TaxID=2497734 RepID=UPI001569F4FC|nr:acetate/propionate family kinase [Marinobacterium sp. xm-d-579]NRP35488.1 Acetate kinase [Marinobacterium sp. xm-d-579]